MVYILIERNLLVVKVYSRNTQNSTQKLSMPICQDINFPPGWPSAPQNVSETNVEDIQASLKSHKTKLINFWKNNLTRSYLFDHFTSNKYKNKPSKSGIWSPKNCQSQSKIAIIIPFRSISNDTEIGRETELTFYLYEMIEFLNLQKIEFKIYVIDQDWEDDFNRARLLNVGFLVAKKDSSSIGHPWDCYLFTDVDKFPINLNLSMHCNKNNQPIHYLPHLGSFGGVAQFPPETVLAVNGFSNEFFGWGGEDQDMGFRVSEGNKIFKELLVLKLKKLGVITSNRPSELAVNDVYNEYLKMSPFQRQHPPVMSEIDPKSSFILETGHRGKGIDQGNEKSPERKQILANFKNRLLTDGLHNLNYKLLKIELKENFNIFSRYKVSFSRKVDRMVSASSGYDKKIDWVNNVLSHKCLDSLISVRECYENIKR